MIMIATFWASNDALNCPVDGVKQAMQSEEREEGRGLKKTI